MIGIIDYGMGNIGSILNMLNRLNQEARVVEEAEQVNSCDKLILPGVGAFDEAVRRLNRMQLVAPLTEHAMELGRPILGICLGMQLLSRSSEEGELPGLGWIDAETIRLRFAAPDQSLRLPHMGWNRIQPRRTNALLDSLPENPRFYFVHSYHVRCHMDENVLATTDYGVQFHSVIHNRNIFGVQFHPEKSHKFGLRLLQNFACLER